MREIKFRQWIKNLNKFHYWGFIDGTFIPPLGEMDDDKRESRQYTGLKDKNNKDIYEGDIVEFEKIDSSDNKFKVKCNIIFKDGCFLANWYGEINSYLNRKDIEVIGNIYQNKELLENGK